MPERMGRGARCATKDGPACMVPVKGEERVVTAQGSLGRVDKGHGVGEEGVRAGRGHRDPTFVAGWPNLCGTSPNLYDNVQEGALE